MKRSERSEVELLASETRGDYGVCYDDRHLGVVRSHVAARVRHPEVMFDLVAEALLVRWKSGRSSIRRGTATGWLPGIARNLVIDSIRHGQVEAASRVRLGMAPVELDEEQLPRILEQGGGKLGSGPGAGSPGAAHLIIVGAGAGAGA